MARRKTAAAAHAIEIKCSGEFSDKTFSRKRDLGKHEKTDSRLSKWAGSSLATKLRSNLRQQREKRNSYQCHGEWIVPQSPISAGSPCLARHDPPSVGPPIYAHGSPASVGPPIYAYGNPPSVGLPRYAYGNPPSCGPRKYAESRPSSASLPNCGYYCPHSAGLPQERPDARDFDHPRVFEDLKLFDALPSPTMRTMPKTEEGSFDFHLWSHQWSYRPMEGILDDDRTRQDVDAAAQIAHPRSHKKSPMSVWQLLASPVKTQDDSSDTGT